METDIEKAENTAFEFPEGTDTILGIAQIEDTQITTETSSSNIIYLIV
ncbi:MAG: hypothetical protein LBC61_01415 [Candidatus Peribacteria bacterium]|jgi:hypothetical protein|nr:hypothetical protein [Candidatus Peribacteria bacterium]